MDYDCTICYTEKTVDRLKQPGYATLQIRHGYRPSKCGIKKSLTTITVIITIINNPTNKYYKCGTKCQAKDTSHSNAFNSNGIQSCFFAPPSLSQHTHHIVLLKQLFKMFTTSRVCLHFHTTHDYYARSMQNVLRFQAAVFSC